MDGRGCRSIGICFVKDSGAGALAFEDVETSLLTLLFRNVAARPGLIHSDCFRVIIYGRKQIPIPNFLYVFTLQKCALSNTYGFSALKYYNYNCIGCSVRLRETMEARYMTKA